MTVHFYLLFLAVAKKKKRRSGRGNEREKERSASPQEMPIDPDEPTYCLCDQVRTFSKLVLTKYLNAIFLF